MRSPRFGGLVVAVAFVWTSSVVSATLAISRGDWVVVVSAVTAAIAGAGWFVAVRQWALWRAFAASLIRERELGDDERPGSSG